MRKRLQKSPAQGPNLVQVAARAGCSTASVSRVLNAPARVRPDIRARVESAIEDLGYRPNSAARALRSRRSHIIGIVIPTLNYAIYAGLVQGLQKGLAASGYSLVVATHEYDLDRESEQARILVERGIEGLAFVGGLHKSELLRLLNSTGVPYINTYVYAPERATSCIGFDNRAASAQIAEFLLELGHRKFGVISALTAANDRAGERVAGVRSALEQHGLELPRASVYECAYSIESGREGFRYLHALPSRPTAVICGNDVLAMGALIECKALRVTVPKSVSIVGFDNVEFAAHLDPPLTTVDVPAQAMGEAAADWLIRRARSEVASSVFIEPKLVVRRSTGRAP